MYLYFETIIKIIIKFLVLYSFASNKRLLRKQLERQDVNISMLQIYNRTFRVLIKNVYKKIRY